jgi:hypothetical protein
MLKMSRIPHLPNNSVAAMNLWFEAMHANGLLFHPEDRAADIVQTISEKSMFSSEECIEVDGTIDAMFEKHGDKVCEVALKYAHKDFTNMTQH